MIIVESGRPRDKSTIISPSVVEPHLMPQQNTHETWIASPITVPEKHRREKSESSLTSFLGQVVVANAGRFR